jgi:hypothetical protein
MIKVLLSILVPVFCFAQDYSFSSVNIQDSLTSGPLFVDNVTVDNTTIGFSLDTDLITVDNGILDVSGTITISSDKRLKENVASLGSTLSKIGLLQPKRYTMYSNQQIEKIGLLAHQVKEVFPELVDDSGKYLAVNYQAFVPALINAMNDLTKKNLLLKQRVEVLKSKLK